jgi:hypothetical protein
MGVKRRNHFAPRKAATGFAMLAAVAASAAVGALAQNPTSAANPFWGSVTAQPVTGETVKLSLDDAIQRGLKNNLGLKETESV